MLEIYKKLSPYALAILVIAQFAYGFMHPEKVLESETEASYNEMSFGVLLRALNSDMVYSIQGTEESEYLTIILKDLSWKEKDEEVQYRVDNSYIVYDMVMRDASRKGVHIIEEELEPESGQESSDFRLSGWQKFGIVLVVVMVFASIIYVVWQKEKKKKSFVAARVVSDESGTIDETQYTKVTFADVAGLEEEKEELVDIVDFLKCPDKYTRLGAKIPKGVLLAGNPGTGKTLLAKAVAGEAGVAYIAVSGSDFVEEYVGRGAKRIRELFKEAREKAPAIIFIDEIDAVASKRRNDETAGDSEKNQTIAELLTELDGFQNRDNIIVLAATNRIGALDPAIMRPGRFDRTVYVDLPDVRGREDILKVRSKDRLLMDDVDLRKIAQNTAGFSGAELEKLLNEASLIAVKKNHDAICDEDLSEAYRKITIGLKKASHIMSETEKRITASHEAGHAVVSLFMSTKANIKEVSIIPHGKAGGYTWHDRAEDKQYTSKTEIVESLAVLMAGRAAEQIVIGDISTGATNDIERATQIATNMVSIYGMDTDIGPISVKSVDVDGVNLLSVKALDDIGDRITEVVKDAENRAKSILDEHRSLLNEVIQILIDQETITGEELQQIYNKYKKANAK